MVLVNDLGDGLLLGLFAAMASSFGLSIWASILYTRWNAQQLLSSEGAEAEARVLAKQKTPEVPTDQLATFGAAGADTAVAGRNPATRTWFLVSFVFDAVRADGVTCRVEVRQRKVPSFVWKSLTEGESVSVRYLKAEPRQCRVTNAAEHEKLGFLAMRIRAFVGLLFFTLGAGFATLTVLDSQLAGVILYACVLVVSALWQLGGRKFLQAMIPSTRESLRRWSPLFMHAGYVFFKELGKDVEPGKPQELEPIVSPDVDIGLTSMGA
mmetsp:Transcript_63388/g.163086  ORF Transcript_63388/g.163086 Transcript_63388/m.163086 type:complete len:267 (+) Transcript_63388:82-882(+)|eukprot:CAMPEP_0195064714 /NCGR_PEP_ID=MMETSP0448-20130528/10631_1 /TAXON_ID=66468 /ORGANISM="Heterocapsa triquestra, Strain CCMP 448" /LENGTH=266 /DNA_ID=CAMNT_0040095747 /DNA_START=75 /DNA_END=875 /DNA_ORIENTATION=-